MCCVAQRHARAVARRAHVPPVFAELQDAVVEVLPTLREQGIAVYFLSEASSTPGISSLSDKIAQASDQPLSRDLRANVHIRSTALYIYTSGTTGNAGKTSTHRRTSSWTVSGDNDGDFLNRPMNSVL